MTDRTAYYPLGEFDASKWAAEFIRLWGHRMDEVDKSLMVAWFANAIMTGYDHGRKAGRLEAKMLLMERGDNR